MINGEEKLLDMYKSMQKIRLCEKKISECYFKGEITGLVHLSAGQEGAQVDAAHHLRGAGAHR